MLLDGKKNSRKGKHKESRNPGLGYLPKGMEKELVSGIRNTLAYLPNMQVCSALKKMLRDTLGIL